MGLTIIITLYKQSRVLTCMICQWCNHLQSCCHHSHFHSILKAKTGNCMQVSKVDYCLFYTEQKEWSRLQLTHMQIATLALSQGLKANKCVSALTSVILQKAVKLFKFNICCFPQLLCFQLDWSHRFLIPEIKGLA